MLVKLSTFILALTLLSSCGDFLNKKKTVSDVDSLTFSADSSYKMLNEQIKRNPDQANLYAQRALVSVRKNDVPSALKDINRAIYLDSNQASFYVQRADIFFKQRETRAAREDFLKSIVLDPKNEEAYLKLAELELVLEKYSQSIDYCNQLLKVNVFSPKAYFMKGMNYKYAGDTASAISSFQTAVEQDDQYYEGYLQLGALFAVQKNPLALDYYNNALRLKPTSLEAIYHKCMFLQETGSFDKALEGYNLMIKIDSTSRNAHFNKGYLYLVYAQDYTKALTSFERVMALYPKDVDAIYNAGVCCDKKKDKKQARIYYKKALEIQPDYELAAKALD